MNNYSQSRVFGTTASTTFVIERGIPLPAATVGGFGRPRSPFTEALMAMHEGESLQAPAGMTPKQASSYINSAQYYRKTTKFAMRTTKNASGTPQVRVWNTGQRKPKQDNPLI